MKIFVTFLQIEKISIINKYNIVHFSLKKLKRPINDHKIHIYRGVSNPK